MKKLLSLPPNLVDCFHDVTGLDSSEWFCTCDPLGTPLGSGGGTTHLLKAAFQATNNGLSFDDWLSNERRLILHAGGQSRRLPAYAPWGKVLTPVPVFRWERGQRLSQDLLSLQIPLYERMMEAAPPSVRTMIVSGDVYIRATESIGQIPDADVICYGLWLGPDIAKDHGVFVSSRKTPSILKCMLQKPSVQTLGELFNEHLYLTDIGLWMFSDRAVKVLMNRSMRNDNVVNYDMYSEFGCALGTDPGICDTEINSLRVAVLPLPGGEFYHFGTSHELLSSTLAVQNLVNDQREIMHHSRKPHPAMFVQNAETRIRITENNRNLWIENSYIGEQWQISYDNIITGVPQNDWHISLKGGQCIDIVPIAEGGLAIRPYGYNDKFRGNLHSSTTEFMGMAFSQWAAERQIEIDNIAGAADLQSACIFPVVQNTADAEPILRWMLSEPQLAEGRRLWMAAQKVSADDILARSDLRRLNAQRCRLRAADWSMLADNYRHSVFYQIDLDDAAHEYAANEIPLPAPLPDSEQVLTRIHDAMFRSEVERLRGKNSKKNEENAFALLRQSLIETASGQLQSPRMSVYGDQIVWGRSPVRIDIAGGWTDTPPYCLTEGGNVINFAIELNGQPPLQAYVRPCSEAHIVLRSIDLGASETIRTYDELAMYNKVGSPFSIPKAALALAGFLPDYAAERFPSLESQLHSFGCGIEITLLSAIPAGSGLGTSSLLASTVLGALNDFCGLAWDKTEIGLRTLVLEQLLTTGGGWQDQFGGLLPGIKLLQTDSGFDQRPVVRWLPSDLYTQTEYRACHLLFYTGITRTAKNILAEIVRKMFLNQHTEIAQLREMKAHTMEMYEAIQRQNFAEMGRLVRKTWAQNQVLDSGTNPESIRRLTDLVDDLCLGYKLPGAGGGGYLYMVAKDPDAAARIKQILNDNRQHPNARFVDMTLSTNGLQVSRS